MNEPFIYSEPRVAIAIEDWAAADGAMLTEDDRVVPMLDLTPDIISVDITFDAPETRP